ncbi:MAG: tRNA (adenosine(37)-N6)-threonylcarbamoyltransferase complex transferase subunit TsaD [Oscillospiraceae bacterium]
MNIFAIESSCDETACAVVADGIYVQSNVIATQIDEHKLYGGVVPEIASRRHCECISQVCAQALSDAVLTMADIDAIAVTYAPGLIGTLLVGVSFAKGLAMRTGKPLVPVHHITGHIAANYLSHPELKPPFLCLVASGGHSHIVEVKSYTNFHVIGRTRDDAAGECFDKAARVLGFDYPGGKFIDEAAGRGNPHAFTLPYPKVTGSAFDFSFSGLKTAVVNLVHNATQKGEAFNRDDVAASFQRVVSEILVGKTIAAARATGYKTIALAGGVAANTGVRGLLASECEKVGMALYLPELRYCGDNAAMIGCQAYFDFQAGKRANLSLNGIATLPLDDLGNES